jgi:hypothetical protein
MTVPGMWRVTGSIQGLGIDDAGILRDSRGRNCGPAVARVCPVHDVPYIPVSRFIGMAADFGPEARLPVYLRTGYYCPECRHADK